LDFTALLCILDFLLVFVFIHVIRHVFAGRCSGLLLFSFLLLLLVLLLWLLWWLLGLLASAAAAAAGQDIMINQSQIVYQTQNSPRKSCWYLVNGIFHPYIIFLDTSYK